MSLKTRKGTLDMLCDQRTGTRCHDGLRTGKVQFLDAVAFAKSCGWTVYAKLGGGYIHCCPRCSKPR